MDHHHPAYWLSREPADAADFLARTAVASRAVGGFVKTAAPAWMTPDVQNALTNAAFGAGVGGLGGLGVGLMSKRKKNPLMSALSGAALGGVMGGALPPAYQYLRSMAADTPPSPGGTPLDAQQAAAYSKMSPWGKLWHHIPGVGAPVADTGPKLPEQQTAFEQAMAKDTPVSLAAKGLGQGAGNIVGGTARAALDNPATAAYHLGVGGAQGMYALKTMPAKAWQEMQRGAQETEIRPGTPMGNKVESDVVDPGHGRQPRVTINKAVYTPETPHSDPGAYRARRFVQEATPSLGRTPFGLPPMERWNPMRRWNEAQLGHELEGIQSGRINPAKIVGPTVGGVTPPAGVGGRYGSVPGAPGAAADPAVVGSRPIPGVVSEPHMDAASISAMRQKGRSAIDAGLAKGVGGKVGGGMRAGRNIGMYALPHLLPYAGGILGAIKNKMIGGGE